MDAMRMQGVLLAALMEEAPSSKSIQILHTQQQTVFCYCCILLRTAVFLELCTFALVRETFHTEETLFTPVQNRWIIAQNREKPDRGVKKTLKIIRTKTLVSNSNWGFTFSTHRKRWFCLFLTLSVRPSRPFGSLVRLMSNILMGMQAMFFNNFKRIIWKVPSVKCEPTKEI